MSECCPPCPECGARMTNHAKCLPCHVRANRRAEADDVALFLSFGEAPEVIVARLGLKPGSVARAMHRQGRPELAKPFDRLQSKLRWAAHVASGLPPRPVWAGRRRAGSVAAPAALTQASAT